MTATDHCLGQRRYFDCVHQIHVNKIVCLLSGFITYGILIDGRNGSNGNNANVDNAIDLKIGSNGSALINPIRLDKYSSASSYFPIKIY